MEPQRYQMFSDETHESLGSCLELDLSIGTILTINGPSVSNTPLMNALGITSIFGLRSSSFFSPKGIPQECRTDATFLECR